MQTKIFPAAGVVIALAIGGLAIAQDEAPPAPPADPALEEAEAVPPGDGAEKPAAGEEAEVEEESQAAADAAEEARRLVSELSNESYQAREEATRKLWGLGEDAMEALEEGQAGDDPEVAYRSRILLQRIRTGITPETRPEVVELVQRYFRSGASGKRQVFEDLHREKAYVQMLRLYRFEEDPKAREECDETLNAALLPAVHEQLVEGRLDAAEELLRLAPPNDRNCRRLAALLRVQGTIEEELRKIEAELEPSPDGLALDESRRTELTALQLALLRAEGKVPEAKALAARIGREDVVASLALFEGDVTPYLTLLMDQGDESPIVRVHAEAVLKRWQGDEAGADQLMKNMAREAREGGDDTDRRALLSLLLNGEIELAMPILLRDHPESAFSYYDTLELPLKALEVKGYTGSSEDKAKWVDQRLKAIERDRVDSDDELFDVLAIASFMHTRGERDECRKLLSALSKIAEAEGNQTWLELVGRLHDFRGTFYQVYQLAFLMAAERLGDEDEDGLASDVMAHLFREGASEGPRRFWSRLEKLDGLTAAERLLMLGGLYGIVPVEAGQLADGLEALRAQADAAEPDDRTEFLGDLLVAAEAREDAGAAHELLLELSKLEGLEKWMFRLAGTYAHMSNWEKTVELWERILEAEPQRMGYLSRYGAALIRAGMADKADKPLRDIERFALDEPVGLKRLAQDLERDGAMDRSEQYWRTLLITNPIGAWYVPSSQYYSDYAPYYYVRHARGKGEWRVAAAFAEVDAMHHLLSRMSIANPVTFLRKRFTADLYRGLALLEEGEHERARKVLRGCFELLNGDGMLADDYFPLLRELGLTDEHDRNFAIAYQRFEESIKAFPHAHNTYNSAAWIASRANRELDNALEKIETALEMRPKQAAYLDTMAEVWFAKGDREKAVEWSWKAVQDSFHSGYTDPVGSMSLREQYERFRDGKMPVP